MNGQTGPTLWSRNLTCFVTRVEGRYSYFACKACQSEHSFVVTFCSSCSNICCIHLMHEFECLMCFGVIDQRWPEWSYQFAR